jgi:hypothetical protein
MQEASHPSTPRSMLVWAERLGNIDFGSGNEPAPASSYSVGPVGACARFGRLIPRLGLSFPRSVGQSIAEAGRFCIDTEGAESTEVIESLHQLSGRTNDSPTINALHRRSLRAPQKDLDARPSRSITVEPSAAGAGLHQRVPSLAWRRYRAAGRRSVFMAGSSRCATANPAARPSAASPRSSRT